MDDWKGAVKALLMGLGLFLCLFGFLVFLSNAIVPHSLWPNRLGRGIGILVLGILILVVVAFAFDFTKNDP
jgi:hypothetical protein